MSTSRRGRSRAEAREETRRELLDAGAALLREIPVGDVLSQVKADAVARRAGRTTGAFYHHWPDQRSYQLDLLDHVLAVERHPSAAQGITADLAGGVPFEELVRRNARASLRRIQENDYFPVQMALWGKHAGDPDLRERLRLLYDRISARLIPAYRDLLDANGLEMRPPFTIEMFAAVLTALAEGLAIRSAVDPDAVPRELPPAAAAARGPVDGDLDEGPWDLFSVVVLGLFPSMTVGRDKRDSDVWLDHEDVRGLVRRLRETWEAMVGRGPGRPVVASAEHPPAP